MLVAAVVVAVIATLLAAAATLAFLRAPNPSARRALAPAQAVAAAILAVGALFAGFAPAAMGILGLVICAAGALLTIGAASWQVAQYALAAEQRQMATGCGTSCNGCPGSGSLCSPSS